MLTVVSLKSSNSTEYNDLSSKGIEDTNANFLIPKSQQPDEAYL